MIDRAAESPAGTAATRAAIPRRADRRRGFVAVLVLAPALLFLSFARRAYNPATPSIWALNEAETAAVAASIIGTPRVEAPAGVDAPPRLRYADVLARSVAGHAGWDARDRATHRVLLRVRVDRLGRVDPASVTVLGDAPAEMAAVARRAARMMIFEPVTVHRHAEDATLVIPLTFVPARLARLSGASTAR
jgi:hypothetical protein